MHCVSIGTFSVSIRDLQNITFRVLCDPLGNQAIDRFIYVIYNHRQIIGGYFVYQLQCHLCIQERVWGPGQSPGELPM